MSSRKGITLIEVVIVTFISVIVTGVIAAILLDAWKGQMTQEAIVQAQLESRFVVNEISTVTRESLGVAVSAVDLGVTYQSTATSVVLRMGSINDSGDIISGTDYFIFRRDPDKTEATQRLIVADPLSARASWQSPLTLAASTANLEFTYYGADGSIIDPVAMISPWRAYAQAPDGGGDITTTTRLGVTHRTSKTVYLRTISRDFSQVVSLRNKP